MLGKMSQRKGEIGYGRSLPVGWWLPAMKASGQDSPAGGVLWAERTVNDGTVAAECLKYACDS